MRLRKLKGWLSVSQNKDLIQKYVHKICLSIIPISNMMFFLGSVISALAEASAKQAANQKAHFIPYRLAYKNLFFMPQISREGGVTEL